MIQPVRPTPTPLPPVPSRPAVGTSAPGDRFESSGTVGRVDLKEAGMVAGAALAGAAVAGLGGLSVAAFGPALGIPVAIVGEAVLGIAVGRALTWGAHDGSAVGGLMMVGAIAGGLGGALGSVVGALSGSPVLGGAVAGVLVAGAFATRLAFGN